MAGLRGRPRKPVEERRRRHIQVRLTDAELARVRTAADAAGLTAAEWARRRILADSDKGEPPRPRRSTR